MDSIQNNVDLNVLKRSNFESPATISDPRLKKPVNTCKVLKI